MLATFCEYIPLARQTQIYHNILDPFGRQATLHCNALHCREKEKGLIYILISSIAIKRTDGLKRRISFICHHHPLDHHHQHWHRQTWLQGQHRLLHESWSYYWLRRILFQTAPMSTMSTTETSLNSLLPQSKARQPCSKWHLWIYDHNLKRIDVKYSTHSYNSSNSIHSIIWIHPINWIHLTHPIHPIN